jgi:hypothetical protein
MKLANESEGSLDDGEEISAVEASSEAGEEAFKAE